jgi:signal transduction histidine kinase
MKPFAEALRELEVLEDLTDSQIRWLVEHSEERRYEAGEVTFQSGQPAEYMIVMIEGEVHARPDDSQVQLPAFIARAGDITGLLPHSRMTTLARTVRAAVPTRVALLHKRHFDEMLAVIPQLESRLIGIMADRIRETAKADLQHEKLAALGKLSAGLAHELNNPAAAIARSAVMLREKLAELLGPDKDAVERARNQQLLDPLERSDREQAVGDALSDRGIAGAWDLAGELVDAGFTAESLPDLETIHRLAAAFAVDRLAGDIEHAACRISDLVGAIKAYTYRDTAAEREIDLHKGLDTTLIMLGHRIKRGIKVTRSYDPAVPRLLAHGGELNQVWTNLIDNGIDSMLSLPDGEKILGLKTALRGDLVLVEISDTGPGIPEEIQGRIFEPFFTTKQHGEGTGLGLDIVSRIVRKHRGEVRVESRPGCTCFQVRLPVKRN